MINKIINSMKHKKRGQNKLRGFDKSNYSQIEDKANKRDKLNLIKKPLNVNLKKLNENIENSTVRIQKQKEDKIVVSPKETTEKNSSKKKSDIKKKSTSNEIITERSQNKKISQEDLSPETYTTHFDKVIELVEKENRVPISKISKLFSIDKKLVQEWGEILKENDLIDFYTPVFGEPEFRKKGIIIKEKRKFKEKFNKKILFLISIILVIGESIFIVALVLKNQPEKAEFGIQEKKESKQEETKKLDTQDKPDKNIYLAFSGNGSYECRSEDGSIRYAIKDTFLKIEKLDGSSKVVIKNNKTYALNIKGKNWTESPLREGIAVPGSGTYPKTILKCQNASIKESEFNT